MDVLVVWKQNDTGLYGRRQEMFLAQLAGLGRVGRILHLDEPAAPERLAKLYLRGAGVTADHSTLLATGTVARAAHRRDEGKVVHRTYIHGGGVTGHLGLPDRAAYPAWVQRQLARTGVGRDRPLVLWAYPSNLDLPAVIDAVDPDLVVTDVVDDNRSWTRPGSALHDEIERNYADVLARSEIVLANCEPVAEMMQPLTATPIEVVPNGLELPTDDAVGPRPADLDGLIGPILGYVGNLSSRIDIDLIELIARARPQWNIVLVGSAHLDRTILRLEYLPNVHFLGVKPYAEARRIIAHLDVGLIPHLDNEMTRAMNPLKAFVYASAGVPVVSTPIANLADLGDAVTVASGRNEWLEAIEAALRRGRVTPDVEALRPHSWDTRMEQVLAAIDAAAARPAADEG
jgi:glycosyltransferase involved in cell wall biosynthesis